jgi:hypothetical protein
MKLSGGILCLLAVAWLGACLSGCGDDDESLSAGVAAKVGSAEIRDSVVRARMNARYVLQGGSVKTFGPPRYTTCMAAKKLGRRPNETDRDIRRQCKVEFGIARAQAVGDLVNEQWLAREARKRGISVKTSPAERALRRAASVAAQTQVKSDPRMRAALVTSVRSRALYDKLVAAMPLSEAEVVEHARSNGELFLASEIRNLHILQTDSQEKADQARRQLERHGSWRTIQNRYGIRPFVEHWTGDHSVKEATAPHDAFGRSMFSSRPKQLVGPIKTLNGWFLFEVIDIRPPAHRGLSRDARRVLSSTLRATKLARTLHAHYAQDTVCDERYVVPEAPACQRELPAGG